PRVVPSLDLAQAVSPVPKARPRPRSLTLVVATWRTLGTKFTPSEVVNRQRFVPLPAAPLPREARRTWVLAPAPRTARVSPQRSVTPAPGSSSSATVGAVAPSS